MTGAVAGGGFEAGWTTLFEREHELRVLHQAIEGATAGRAGLVFVEGPAGIGKSRLGDEMRVRAAERGLLVLAARGSELERDFPFGVVRQLFEPRLTDAIERERALGGAARSASGVFGPPGLLLDDDAPGDGFAALHGLFWLAVNLSAQAPLLLTVDDLHWCDRSSLRFLAYLARRLDGLPILVVGTVRRSEPGADEALLAELMGDPQATVLTPQPLTAGAACELVGDRLGEGVAPEFAAACHAATNGNPLLLGELVKALRAEGVPPDDAHVDIVGELGPKAASRAVLLRLARLSADAVMLARSLAVLGDGADPVAVGAHASLDRDAVAVAARALVRAEIVRPQPPLAFVHPLVRATVYHDLGPGERELSHDRAARILHDLDAPAEQVAAHVVVMPRCGEAWVVATLRAAARAAFAKGAPDAAITSLRRALVEPVADDLRGELLFELGRAQALTSLPDSAQSLERAYECASDPTTRAHAADWLVCTLNFLDAPDDAAAIARRVSVALPLELGDLGRELEAGELISLFFGGRDDDGARLERLRGHRAIAASAGRGAKMLAAVAAWEWAESAGPAEGVVALARSALEGGTLVAADAGYLTIAAILPLALADLDEATVLWNEVRAEAHRSGFVFTLLAAQLWGGYTQYLRGDLAEAESELQAARASFALWGVPAQQSWATAVLAEVLVERGAIAEARALLDGAATARPGSDPAILLDRAEMCVRLAEGRAADALEHSEVFEAHAGWRRHPRYVPWRSLTAQALDRLGRQDDAVALATEELVIARQWGSPGTVGRSLRVLGAIERGDGLDHLREACALLESVPARLERAEALTALGAALRRTRRPTDAREPLRLALELAEICGATALVERTRTELYATGVRPRRTSIHGVGALTASERRVADLAAGGLSNVDIAQALYVTPKTVEVHLSSTYRKLGIGSRRKLPEALAAT